MEDRELVAAIAANDPRGLDVAYRRYADALFSYSRTLIGDREAAADAVHDTFLLASKHISQLRDPTRLRQWLYAIARHEGLRQLRHRSRHAPLEAAPEPVLDTADIAASVHSAEVVEAVRSAMNGLSAGSREVAELAVRHNMSAPEIATVLDVPLNHAHAQLSRAREQLLSALEALLVARGNQDACPALAELLKGWDGQLTALLRKRVNRHIETCASCDGARKGRLNPAALLSGYALLAFPAMPDLTPTSASASPPPAPKWHSGTGFPVRPKPARSVAKVAAAAIAVVAVMAATGGAWLLQAGEPVASPPLLPRSAPALPPAGSPATSPSPSLSPSPAARTSRSASAKPVSPAPLAFTAVATATCGSGGSFTLTVTVNANAALSASVLTWTGPAPHQQPMVAGGRTARSSVTGFSSVAQIPWSVEIKDRDGRELRGPDQSTANPCQ